MFQTSKDMQLRSYLGGLPSGRQQWHSIIQTLLIRWFQIRYICTDSSIEQILMTGDLEVLEAINTDPSFHLLSVNLVSPPTINGTDNWAISPLRSVVTLIRHNLDMEELLGFEYHLHEGRVLVESLSGTLHFDHLEIERFELLIQCNPMPRIQLVSH
jgi:hypothetical protein